MQAMAEIDIGVAEKIRCRFFESLTGILYFSVQVVRYACNQVRKDV